MDGQDQPPSLPDARLFASMSRKGNCYDNAIAVRSGQWKLIETTNSKSQKAHLLYDLSADPGETNNIAKAKPELVKQLAAELDKARADGRTRN